MPFSPNDRPLMAGETFWWRIPDIYLGTALLTDTNAPDSFVWEIVTFPGGVATGATGNMVHSGTAEGTWEAELTAPAISGTYHARAKAIDADSVGEWVDSFYVRAYR